MKTKEEKKAKKTLTNLLESRKMHFKASYCFHKTRHIKAKIFIFSCSPLYLNYFKDAPISLLLQYAKYLRDNKSTCLDGFILHHIVFFLL